MKLMFFVAGLIAAASLSGCCCGQQGYPYPPTTYSGGAPVYTTPPAGAAPVYTTPALTSPPATAVSPPSTTIVPPATSSAVPAPPPFSGGT